MICCLEKVASVSTKTKGLFRFWDKCSPHLDVLTKDHILNSTFTIILKICYILDESMSQHIQFHTNVTMKAFLIAEMVPFNSPSSSRGNSPSHPHPKFCHLPKQHWKWQPQNKKNQTVADTFIKSSEKERQKLHPLTPLQYSLQRTLSASAFFRRRHSESSANSCWHSFNTKCPFRHIFTHCMGCGLALRGLEMKGLNVLPGDASTQNGYHTPDFWVAT